MKVETTKNLQIEQILNVLSKRDLVLIKTTIALFGIVLNICLLQLYFY
jgi:hypothetical protein